MNNRLYSFRFTSRKQNRSKEKIHLHECRTVLSTNSLDCISIKNNRRCFSKFWVYSRCLEVNDWERFNLSKRWISFAQIKKNRKTDTKIDSSIYRMDQSISIFSYFSLLIPPLLFRFNLPWRNWIATEYSSITENIRFFFLTGYFC